MKKLHITLGIIFIASLVFASEPYSVTVASNSVSTIVPKRTSGNAGAWVTNEVYAQGQYAKANNRIYMALVGGTSTNGASETGPSVNSGTVIDNTVTWLRVPSKSSAKRVSALIFKTDSGAGVCYLAPGGVDPSVNAGIPLGLQYSYYEYSGQGEVRAIATNTTVTLSVQEVEAP